MRYLLVDAMNMFFRARHTAARAASLEDKMGMAIHITLASISKAWRLHNADHVVFCLDGHSWRKEFYEPYKKNRAVARAAMSESEQEENEAFFQAYDDLVTFFDDKTNVTVLNAPNAEADDLIARWISIHSDDDHTIVSSDSDLTQLLTAKVDQYNGITQELITLNGIFNDLGKPVIDKKTKLPKSIPDPQWLLFEKCMRGDASDNVFSAYPGVRIKGTKNKTGLVEAYSDMHKKGYAWNNLMLQRWTDHNGNEHRVLDDYERNRHLIDLTAQPDDIKAEIDLAITNQSIPKKRPMVGAQFLKFCGRHNLQKISENANTFGEILSASYPE
jgi:5'-3' exonuclease